MVSAKVKNESNNDSDLSVTFKLDVRKTKKDGTYPVKLCICHKPSRKAKYYGTTFSFTPEVFKSIGLTNKPRKIYQPSIVMLKSLVNNFCHPSSTKWNSCFSYTRSTWAIGCFDDSKIFSRL